MFNFNPLGSLKKEFVLGQMILKTLRLLELGISESSIFYYFKFLGTKAFETFMISSTELLVA